MTAETKKLIGVTGKVGAGKSTFIREFLRRVPEAERIGISDLLKEKLNARGVEPTRQNLTAFANELRKEFGLTAIVDLTNQHIKESTSAIILIDGVRGQRMRELLLQYPGSRIVAVVAGSQNRYARLRMRGEKADEHSLSPEEFATLDERDFPSAEAELLERQADFRIENNGTSEEFVTRVGELVTLLTA